jgi:hypothetical protein
MDKEQIKIEQVLRMLVPDDLVEYFEIKQVKENKNEWVMELEEKEDFIPKELKGKEAVLNGFCSPIEIQSFPVKGKSFYIKIIRRKWKEKGKDTAYSNDYDLHYKGMKATKEFGDFLKDAFRLTPTKFSNIRDSIMRKGR